MKKALIFAILTATVKAYTTHISDVLSKLLPNTLNVFKEHDHPVLSINGRYFNACPKSRTVDHHQTEFWVSRTQFDQREFSLNIRDNANTKELNICIEQHQQHHQQSKKYAFPHSSPFKYKTLSRDKLYNIVFKDQEKVSDIKNFLFLLKFLEFVPFGGLTLESCHFKYLDVQNVEDFNLEIKAENPAKDKYQVTSECFNGTFNFITDRI